METIAEKTLKTTSSIQWATVPVEDGLRPLHSNEDKPQDENAQFRQTIMIDTDSIIRDPEKFAALQNSAKTNIETWKKDSLKTTNQGCTVQVVGGDTLDVALQLAKEWGEIPTVLNMANAIGPGGGYRKGMAAQEENVFRRSTCATQVTSNELNPDNQFRYNDKTTNKINAHPDENGKRRVVLEKVPRVCFRSSERIVNDNITDDSYNLLPKDERFPFYELKAAAMDPRNRNSKETLPFDEAEMKARIKAQLDTLVDNGHRIVVLSAFGCGAFKNPAKEVAKLYAEVLADEKYKSAFDILTFAIYFAGYGDDNLPAFTEALDGITPGVTNFTRLSDFFTTPSFGRNALIGLGVGLLTVGVIAAAVLLTVGTAGVAPAIFGVAATAALGAYSGFALGAIGVGIVGFITVIAVGVGVYFLPPPMDSLNNEKNNSNSTTNLESNPFKSSDSKMNKLGLAVRDSVSIEPLETPDITPKQKDSEITRLSKEIKKALVNYEVHDCPVAVDYINNIIKLVQDNPNSDKIKDYLNIIGDIANRMPETYSPKKLLGEYVGNIRPEKFENSAREGAEKVSSSISLRR